MVWFVVMGIVTGMRSFTAMAVLCWCAYLAYLPQPGWASWVGSLLAVILFTAIALGEYVGDVLPKTPSRLAPGPLGARIVIGAFAGVLSTHAMGQPIAGGAIFGILGALIGAFGGAYARRYISARVGRDLPVGISESIFALGLAILSAAMLHHEFIIESQRTFL